MKTPKTKEERAAAARKYGMIEEDYVPYGEDEHPEWYMGDYPKLKPVGADERPGHHNWDFPNLKKDFGEPMDEDWYAWQSTRCDTGRKFRPPWMGLRNFLLICIPWYLIIWFSPRIYYPMLEPQLAANGPHYTFEPVDE